MHSGAITDNTNTAYLASEPPTSSNSYSQYGTDALFDAAAPHASGDSDVGGGSGGNAVNPSSDGFLAFGDKVNRIARYEAMGALPSTSGGFDAGFIVTKTNWTGKSPNDSPVARFPNEVLIHILSFLEPSGLLTASLISKRFHALINSPHAWRSAFVRFFPPLRTEVDEGGSPLSTQDRRYFTRLSASDVSENGWRKEYMQRTRLLRSLSKGKVHDPGASSRCSYGGLMVSYDARAGPLSVSHMAVGFAPNGVRAVHASLESQLVSASDPTTGKIEKRIARRDPLFRGFLFTPAPDLRQIRNDHPDFGVAMDMNVNRVMDISEEFGWVMGENIPDGRCYVHPYPNPHIGDGLERTRAYIEPGDYGLKPAVTCLWIAKKRSGGVRDSTGAAVIIGNSRGYVRIFSADLSKPLDRMTQVRAYCISPGVPITQIKVDEDFLPRRLKQGRPWVTIVNALGEIYYLRNKPTAASDDGWRMIPETARMPTPVYAEVFPELSQELSWEQLEEKHKQRTDLLLNMDYAKIKELWEGCRMDWFIEVDWAGENIVAGRAGSESYWYGNLTENADMYLKRFHRRPVKTRAPETYVRGISRSSPDSTPTESIFSGDDGVTSQDAGSSIPMAEIPDEEPQIQNDEWISTELRMDGKSFTRITAYSLDNSHLARLTASEDPTLREGLPGGNGRLFAVGTNTGSIFVFNIRPTSLAEPVGHPIRTIHTDSPQISTLALSSLVVVHGGDDGLVQAWDPLGSTRSPVRTLHSRFSARARRRIEQNVGMAATDNQFAARCLVLDPDPMRLRGAVALGTFIRYWSFSVDATSGVTKKKRKKFGGGSRINGTPTRSKDAIREAIQSDELALRRELEQARKEAEELEKRYGISARRDALNEEEMLAYARMISQETFEMESSTNRSEVGSSLSGRSSDTVTSDGSFRSAPFGNRPPPDSEDADLELALRLSLQEVEVSEMDRSGEQDPWDSAFTMEPGPSDYSFEHWSVSPSKPVSSNAFGPCSASTSPTKSNSSPRKSTKKGGWEKVSLGALDGWSGSGKARDQEFDDDLELAIRLSLQEQEAAKQWDGKGKGKGVVF